MLRFNGVDAVDDTNVDDVNLWTERVGPLLNKTAAQYSGLWVDRYKESNGEKQPENLWTYYAKSNDDTGFLVICDTVKLKSVVKEGSFTGLEYHAKELAIIGKKTSFLENDPIFETTIFFDQFKKIDHVIQKGASVPSLYTAMNYTGRKSIFSTFKNKCDNK